MEITPFTPQQEERQSPTGPDDEIEHRPPLTPQPTRGRALTTPGSPIILAPCHMPTQRQSAGQAQMEKTPKLSDQQCKFKTRQKDKTKKSGKPMK